MLSSPIVEQKVLAGCLQHQEDFALIDNQIAERDFDVEASKVHVTIFKLIRHAARNKEIVDENILISRLQDLGVSFEDNIDPAEYIRNLAFRKVSKEAWKTAIDELKKFSARRELVETMRREISFLERGVDPSAPLGEIIGRIDKTINQAIQQVGSSEEKRETNLFATLEEDIEFRGANPIENFGPKGPYRLLHEMYGSLFRPGNLSFLVARAKVGKTTFALDYSMKVAYNNDFPIIHFDNGEMNEEELKYRIMAAVTDLPIWMFETGEWARISSYKGMGGDQIKKKVRDALKKWNGNAIQFYYYNIAGMNGDEVSNLLKRVYYTKVGRGKECGLSLDYVKLDFSSGDTQNQWVSVAKMIDKIKQTVHKEILVDGKPVIGVFTSVQANRSGITRGKKLDEIKEDESVVSMTDAISHFCSHLFLFRKMVEEEITEYGEDFGTHILKNILARHLGKDHERALTPVDFRDRKCDNFIAMRVKNFSLEECGDLNDIAEAAKCKEQLKEEVTESRIPKEFAL